MVMLVMPGGIAQGKAAFQWKAGGKFDMLHQIERKPMRLTLAFCLLPFAAVAQDVDCDNATAQQEMNSCAEQEWQAADVDLNTTFAAVLAVMQESDQTYPAEGKTEEARLREAQRAWVAYRDAACDSAGYPMRGGSAEPLLTNDCMWRLTTQRTDDLKSLIETY